MPGVSPMMAGAEELTGIPRLGAPRSARVGESDAGEFEFNDVVPDPRSIAVGRSAPVATTSSPEEPLPTEIFPSEDCRPLSSGREGFLGTIAWRGTDCRPAASAVPG